MSIADLPGLRVTQLRRIAHEKGDILHALKSSEEDFDVFGEAYFTAIHRGATKGWKQHLRMRMNLIVPLGRVRFHLRAADGRAACCVEAGGGEHRRISVDPGLWMAFEGLEETNLVLNLASIEHDPGEARDVPLDTYPLCTNPDALE